MKEPYGKGLATRPGPESCAGHGNMTGEALARAHVRYLNPQGDALGWENCRAFGPSSHTAQ
jgi:hypothetical protein